MEISKCKALSFSAANINFRLSKLRILNRTSQESNRAGMHVPMIFAENLSFNKGKIVIHRMVEFAAPAQLDGRIFERTSLGKETFHFTSTDKDDEVRDDTAVSFYRIV